MPVVSFMAQGLSMAWCGFSWLDAGSEAVMKLHLKKVAPDCAICTNIGGNVSILGHLDEMEQHGCTTLELILGVARERASFAHAGAAWRTRAGAEAQLTSLPPPQT